MAKTRIGELTRDRTGERSKADHSVHPTQKSVSGRQPLVQSFPRRGGLVFDPSSGSGSTLVAVQIEGRDLVGIEVDPSIMRSSAVA
jgi:DNA modification methylase